MKRIIPLILVIFFTLGFFNCKSKIKKSWEGTYERMYGSVRFILVLKSDTWYKVKITGKRDVDKRPNSKIIDKGDNTLHLVSDEKGGYFRVKYSKNYIDVWWVLEGKERNPNRYMKRTMVFSY